MIDQLKIKQMRRQLLSHLNMLYPAGLRLESLFNTVVCFDETYSKILYVKDVTYLKNKGYIRFADDALGGAKDYYDKVAILTESGKDIADRITVDPTLEL